MLTDSLEYLEKDASKWGIFKLVENKDDFLRIVVETVVQKFRIEFPTTRNLYDELASALYQERIRVTTSRWRSDAEDEKDFWNNIKGQIIKFHKNGKWEATDRKALESILKKILYRYAYEMVAGFNPTVFRFAQKFLPKVLMIFLHYRFLNPLKIFNTTHRGYFSRFKITGPFDLIRNLAKECTVIVVPTHFSNTDSPIVGWALHSIGLEPVTYGAGSNLFGTQPVSFFMNNLGAYKLDRRRKNKIYTEILKTYSQTAIEYDTPSLFFPGGTRSRSGSIENKLKLGLLSTAIEAQQENFIHDRKKIVILPLVINYQYNVEASSLVIQHLKEIGKEKYVADNFEYSTTYKVWRFIKQLFKVRSELIISFGKPLDVIGNEVNENGQSISKQGQIINIKGYFEIENKIVKDDQRNFEYTKILGDKILNSFYTYNTVMSAPLVAFVYFRMLQKRHKNLSLFEQILLPREDRIVHKEYMINAMEVIQNKLMNLQTEKKIQLSKAVSTMNASKLLEDGIQNLNLFNSKNIVYQDSDKNYNSQDLRLAFFYHNRLKGYGLEKSI